MKIIACLVLVFFASCNTSTKQEVDQIDSSAVEVNDQPADISPSSDSIRKDSTAKNSATGEIYQNQRFKDVTVERLSTNRFRVKGKGQIFEASFSWVIEDGHNEIKKGYDMTNAGAPEWGDFDFVVDAVKQRENSTLTLILFESSAKDGSRQHQLPIKLY